MAKDIYIYTGHQDMQHILSHVQSDVHQPWHVKSVLDPVSTGPTPSVTDTGATQVGQDCSDQQMTPEVALPQVPGPGFTWGLGYWGGEGQDLTHLPCLSFTLS